MNRGDISTILRRAGLLFFADHVRYYLQKIKHHSSNREFRIKHPNLKMPPDYLLYESFSMNYSSYYHGGKESAGDIYGYLLKHKSPKGSAILDWGCGPGRIIRHMPEFFDPDCRFYGCDYNARSVDWCTRNLPDISFTKNNLAPPLNYEDKLFDMIYGISIFTHLSEAMHHAWIKELHRVLNQDGIALLTTAGKNFKSILTQDEIIRFDKGELIVRDKVREGHRTFTSVHPESFVKKLFLDFQILEHIVREPVPGFIPQDIWIIRKT